MWVLCICRNSFCGSKRDSLQAVELSQRVWPTAVQIAIRAHCMAGIASHESGRCRDNPGQTTIRKQVRICDICHRQMHSRKQILIRCNRIEHGVHLDVQVPVKHNIQILGPAIHTKNPDSKLTQT